MTETKKITLKILGAEIPEVKDVQIEKGTTPADIKREMKIPIDFQAYYRPDDRHLTDSTDLYKLMPDNEKLEFHPKSELGVDSAPLLFFDRGNNLEEIIIPKIAPTIRPRITHKIEPSIHITPSEKLGLDAELRNLGWNKVGRDYVGKVQGRSRSYNAMLRNKGNGDYDLLIQAPSSNLFNGAHKACFTYFRDNYYHVHFKNGRNPISKISKLQQYIKQAGG